MSKKPTYEELEQRIKELEKVAVAHKQAEEALLGSERLYRALLEQAADSIVLIDVDTLEVVGFNDRAYENLEYTREEFEKLRVPDFEVIEPGGEVANHMDNVIKEGADPFETKHRTKDNEIRHVQVSSKAISIRGRECTQNIWHDITEWVKVRETLQKAHDELEQRVEERTAELVVANEQLKGEIEERKRAEQAFRESQEKYKSLSNELEMILDHIPALIFYKDTENNFIRVNKYVADTYKMAKKDLEGKNMFELGPKEDAQRYWAEDLEVIESRKPKINMERFLEIPRGKRWALSNKIPYIDKDGNVKGIIGICLDITKRKQAEEALRESERQLRFLSSQLLTAQENERKRIAQELHDGIGQILTAIKFGMEDALNRMGKVALSPDIKALEAIIPMAKNGIEEARRICTNLRPSILDDLGILATISWFCREFQTIYSGILIEKQIDIQENEVPDTLKIVIYRVLQEALNNIAKHSKAELVRLFLRKTEGTIDLSIEDNGLGFDLQDAISTDRLKRGLGLASMEERIELSGGSFSIESRRGAGTIVRATWPRK